MQVLKFPYPLFHFILSYLVLFSKLFFAFAGLVSVLENGSRAPGTTSIDELKWKKRTKDISFLIVSLRII